jgi:hypothetical protein
MEDDDLALPEAVPRSRSLGGLSANSGSSPEVWPPVSAGDLVVPASVAVARELSHVKERDRLFRTERGVAIEVGRGM